MPGIAWILLNAVLVVAAIGGTVAVKSRPAPAPVALEESSGKNEDAKKASPAAAAPVKAASSAGLAADASLDELWQHTLFLPSREEVVATEGGMTPEEAARAAALAAQKIDFELVGIAQMALPGKEPAPVALLRNKVASNGRSSRRPNRLPGRGERGAVAPEAESSTTPTQLVFRVGEAVNSTGYKVKSIDVASRSVEVERGAEVVKLTINFTSEEANRRREAVASMENTRKAQAAAEAARAQAAPAQSQPAAAQSQTQPQAARVDPRQNAAAASQPPSGPPGALQNTSGQGSARGGTGSSSSGSSSSDRASRIRRAMEARQRAARGGDTP